MSAAALLERRFGVLGPRSPLFYDDPLAAHGVGLAAILLCSVFSSEGLPTVPAGYLSGMAELAHAPWITRALWVVTWWIDCISCSTAVPTSAMSGVTACSLVSISWRIAAHRVHPRQWSLVRSSTACAPQGFS
jgi:hypothetical protein